MIVLPNSPEFTILDANEAYLGLVGIGGEDIISKCFFFVFPSSDFPDEMHWEVLFDEVIRERRVISKGIKNWVPKWRGPPSKT